MTENSFCRNPKPVGVAWLRERPMSWGESQLQVRGHAERKRQPEVPHDEKLAFQMTAKDQTTQRSSGCVSDAPIEELQELFLFSFPSFLSCLPRGNQPRNSQIWKGGQGGARRSETGQKTWVWVRHSQLLKLLYHFPHRLEGNLPAPPASTGPTGPPVGRVLTEEHMGRRGEAASQSQSALTQAQSWEHSSRVEAGRKCG